MISISNIVMIGMFIKPVDIESSNSRFVCKDVSVELVNIDGDWLSRLFKKGNLIYNVLILILITEIIASSEKLSLKVRHRNN